MAAEKKTVVTESRRLGNTRTPSFSKFLVGWRHYLRQSRFCQRLENRVSKFFMEPFCVCPGTAARTKKREENVCVSPMHTHLEVLGIQYRSTCCYFTQISVLVKWCSVFRAFVMACNYLWVYKCMSKLHLLLKFLVYEQIKGPLVEGQWFRKERVNCSRDICS